MWPDGAVSAASFTFDFDAEEVWIGEDPANADRPGVLSQGTYGAKVAVPLILDVLRRHGVQATFFVPGRVAERYPERVADIVAAGHELAHHGYTHTSPAKLTRAEEEAELVRGLRCLRGFGTEVTGYRSPSWDLSPHTLDLLRRARAYLLVEPDGRHPAVPARHPRLVEVPISWILDDAPHFWFDGACWTKTIATTAAVRQIWEEEFLGIRRLGGACVFTMHPQIIGRPGRLAFLDAFIGFVTGHDDVWVSTTAQIASRA